MKILASNKHALKSYVCRNNESEKTYDIICIKSTDKFIEFILDIKETYSLNANRTVPKDLSELGFKGDVSCKFKFSFTISWKKVDLWIKGRCTTIELNEHDINLFKNIHIDYESCDLSKLYKETNGLLVPLSKKDADDAKLFIEYYYQHYLNNEDEMLNSIIPFETPFDVSY